jgi:hypothetical protein
LPYSLPQAYPADGTATFANIYMEVDGKHVVPQWTAAQEQPACNSKCEVVDPATITITWDADAADNESAEPARQHLLKSPPAPLKWTEANATL